VIGDPASLPAINSLLGAVGSTVPATIWFEGGTEDLPFHTAPPLHEVRRLSRGQLADQVRVELPALLKGSADPYVWITCDTATTRGLSSYVRRELGVRRERVHALGYWRTT
jgi:NADPH-dependent ferric siderophore reductase